MQQSGLVPLWTPWVTPWGLRASLEEAGPGLYPAFPLRSSYCCPPPVCIRVFLTPRVVLVLNLEQPIVAFFPLFCLTDDSWDHLGQGWEG